MFKPYKIRQEMKKAISIFRIAILALMGSVGVLFLLGEEQDETVLSFFLHFLFDKVFGLAMLAAMVYLAARWIDKDKWLKAIVEWCCAD
jgi:hypothetical protein